MSADAPNTLRAGRELIAHYLCPDRRPVERQWSRKHADTQRDLCVRYLEPVIGDLPCQDIKPAHMQAAVNAAPTAREGKRVRACVSALVSAGIAGGYLTSTRLKDVHWRAHGRPVHVPRGQTAGESVLYVDPGEIPGPAEVHDSIERVELVGEGVAAHRHRCDHPGHTGVAVLDLAQRQAQGHHAGCQGAAGHACEEGPSHEGCDGISQFLLGRRRRPTLAQYGVGAMEPALIPVLVQPLVFRPGLRGNGPLRRCA
jgi:hypothetical protein